MGLAVTVLQVFNLTEGTNLIKNQLDRMGVREDWMEESQETGSFAYVPPPLPTRHSLHIILITRC